MESSLVKFLTLRQIFRKSALNVWCVDNIGNGAVIERFGNDHSQLRQQGVTIVRGWLAEPRQHSQVRRQFTQRWWNFGERSRQYLDTWPEIEKGSRYIMDREIALFPIDNNDRHLSCKD